MPTTTKTRAALSKMNKEALIEAFQDLQSALKSAPAIPPAIASEVASKAKEVVAAAKPLTVDTLVTKGAQFKLDFQRTIDVLLEQATAKAAELETLQSAVELADRDMEKRYNLEVAKASVDMLISDYEARAAELDASIKARQDAWTVENDALTKSFATKKTELEAARSRESAEYDYRTRTERARATEEFNHNLAIEKRNQAERQSEFEASIAKVKALHTAEAAQLDADKARVAALEAGIEGRVTAAVTEKVTSAVTSERIKFAMEKKDLERELALAASKNQDLVSQNSRQQSEIATLNEALRTARNEVSTVAANAFAAVNGQSALRAVQDNLQATSSSTRGKAA